MGDGGDTQGLVPRLCHIVKWSDFNGYGFNLHAEKGKAGQFIGKVDEGSPAQAAGLKQGDRIVEVNGTNIGNENHQQVVGRVRAGGEETRLLVVDAETDQVYKDQKKIVRGELPEVLHLTAVRDDKNIEPQEEETTAVIASVSNGDAPAVVAAAAAPEPELEDECARYPPRLCHLCKWPDFDGYGFNLHADREKPGQYIGSVDPDSPAEMGGLRENDRIIEVNGENIESQTHTVVIQKIKAGGDHTSMLVVDRASDEYYKGRGITVTSAIPSTVVTTTPPRTGEVDVIVNAPEPPTVVVTSDEPDRSSYLFEDVVAEESREVEAFPPPLPEPDISLSEDDEETVTAVVSETVESSPPPEPEAVANGTEEEEEMERMEEAAAAAALVWPAATDDVAVAEAFDTAVTVGDDAGDVVVAAREVEEEEVVVSGGGGEKVDEHAYEEVDVSCSAITTTTTVTTAYESDFALAAAAVGSRYPPSAVKVTCVKVKAEGADSDDDIFTMVKEPPAGFHSYSELLEARVDVATAVAAGPPSIVIETGYRVAGEKSEDTPKEEKKEEEIEVQEEKNEPEEEEKTEKDAPVGIVAAAAAAGAVDLAVKEEEEKEDAANAEAEEAEHAAIMADYEMVPPREPEEELKKEPEAEAEEAAIEAVKVVQVESAPAAETVAVSEEMNVPEPDVNGAASAAVVAQQENGGDPNYEEVMVTAPATAAEPEPEPEPQQELPSNGASNGINGGTVEYEPAPEPTPEPQPQPKEPEPVPEPQAAVIRSTVTTTPVTTDADPILKMSAAEMKERLRQRKKQDPRLQKTSFSDKHKMFERM